MESKPNLMTPKEYADWLFRKMYGVRTVAPSDISKYFAKWSALVAVDEMIRIAPWGGDIDNEMQDDSKEYYMKVKEELEKI
jgi:hypothetical protein